MFSPANQTPLSLTIDGFEPDFQVLAFTGEEAINRPYFFNLELVGEEAGLDLQRLFDTEAFLAFGTQGEGIHGRVYHIAQRGKGRYNLALVPHLSYLRHRLNRRVYQQYSVPDIVALILEEHGILGGAYRFHLRATYPKRECCTQYDETDLHFIQRLCEEEGIHFHFQHSPQGHVLVFGDELAAFPRGAQVTAKRQGNDRLTKAQRGQPYHPGLAAFDRPALEHGHETYLHTEGRGDQTWLASGQVVPISGTLGQERNDLWLLTWVIHEGKQPQVLRDKTALGSTGSLDDFDQGYRNRFTALPWDRPYRPPVAHRKPLVPSTQTAVVIAVEGEEARPARVKVKFPWDREGRFDDKSSCWLDASHWQCEAILLGPGTEVMVTFIDSDPCRPWISACPCCG